LTILRKETFSQRFSVQKQLTPGENQLPSSENFDETPDNNEITRRSPVGK